MNTNQEEMTGGLSQDVAMDGKSKRENKLAPLRPQTWNENNSWEESQPWSMKESIGIKRKK